jgi:GTPase
MTQDHSIQTSLIHQKTSNADSSTRIIALYVTLGQKDDQDDLDEFLGLITATGGDIVDVVTASRHAPVIKTFVGQGKIDELKLAADLHHADLVVINHVLSPSQERNLERSICARVLDRTGLILDLFAQRAQSFEGKLQVELAQLTHLTTKLVRGWTHLERQKGGIGLRGPGETQLETDRRLIRGRVQLIKKRLHKVMQQRRLSKQSRAKKQVKTVALVGYTNAGKSTLFNALTRSDVLVKDQLFATLDTTVRQCYLGSSTSVVLVDTVGFIRRLPHELVAAFQATLETVVEADLILHVMDVANPEQVELKAAVEEVLCYLKADHIPRLEVMNQWDKMTGERPRRLLNQEELPDKVWCSAITGDGFEDLKQCIVEHVSSHDSWQVINPEDMETLASYYENQQVIATRTNEKGLLEVLLNKDQKGRDSENSINS